MSAGIASDEQVTAEWLEPVLRQDGCLPSGHVMGIERSARTTTTSVVVRLNVRYSHGAPQAAPPRLLLKICKPGFHPQFGQSEVDFYSRVAPAMDDPPLAHCYHATYSPETGYSHVLLADLSTSHFRPESRQPPSRENCERMMDCLARFHAFWWEHPRLGKDIGSVPTGDYLSEIEGILPAFLSFLGDQLPVAKQTIYRRVLSALPGLWQRFESRHLPSGRGLTLIHGDAHCGNFLVPRDAGKHSIRIIDWQFWNVNTGPRDLAFMIARNWTREDRRLTERTLVRRYHEELLRHEVKGYEWEDCWEDYRECAVENIFIPMWQWHGQITLSTDWAGLNRAFDAFEDLKCAEIL